MILRQYLSCEASEGAHGTICKELHGAAVLHDGAAVLFGVAERVSRLSLELISPNAASCGTGDAEDLW